MAETSESVLQRYLQAIRRRWAAGVIVAAAVLAVSVPVAVGLPNLYRSSASLMVDQAPDPLSQSSAQMLALTGRLQQIRQEALSRQRVTELANELDLYPELRQAGSIDAIVAQMHQDVRVEPTSSLRGDGRETTVSFRVSYVGRDREKVAAVANRLAQFYVERNGAIRTRQAARTEEQLKQELDATKTRLDAQEKRVIDFAAQNAGTLPSQVSSITTRYGQLTSQVQANAAEIARLVERHDNAQTEIARLSTPTASADATDPAIRLLAAERELAALLGRGYTEASFEVRNKRNEVAGLKRQLAEASTSTGGPNPAASQLSTLQRQIGEWTARIEELRRTNVGLQLEMDRHDATLERAPVRSAEFERFTRDAAQTRQQYDSLYLRHQNALAGERAEQGQSGTEFQVLDPAVPAESPSAPARLFLLALSVMLAAGCGAAIVLLLDGIDGSFKSVDEVRAFTHVPVLATIPRITSREAKVRQVVLRLVAGGVISVVLGLMSFGVFRFAQQAEPIVRMLLR